MFFFALMNLLGEVAKLPTEGWSADILGAMTDVPMIVLVPRFILNLRELHAQELRGRCGSDIDTAFGFTWTSNGCAVASAVMIVDVESGARSEEGEEVEMEEGK